MCSLRRRYMDSYLGHIDTIMIKMITEYWQCETEGERKEIAVMNIVSSFDKP
jgi:hypothetical protein